MTDIKDRQRRLTRLLDVQTQLRRKEEWRLARLANDIRELAEEERQVFAVLNEDETLGGLFVDVRARRLKKIGEEATRLTAAHIRQTQRVIDRKRREKGAERLSHDADRDALEADAKRELDEAIERTVQSLHKPPTS